MDQSASASEQSSDSTEATEEQPEPVSLESVLAEIGATGNEGPVNGTTYTFEGVEYSFEEPSDWELSMSQRMQACEQGFVNTSYQIATDGSTWFATTDSNDDYAALVSALVDAGLMLR